MRNKTIDEIDLSLPLESYTVARSSELVTIGGWLDTATLELILAKYRSLGYSSVRVGDGNTLHLCKALA